MDGVPAQQTAARATYAFGYVVVDVLACTVTRAGQPQPLEPKAYAVLVVLLAHAGDLVPREALLDSVWGHRHVTPGVLTRAITQIRHALADDPRAPRYIRTRHALGYAFIGQLDAGAGAVEHVDARPDMPRVERRARRRHVAGMALAALAVALVLAAYAWHRSRAPRAPAPAMPRSVAVLPFARGAAQVDDSFAHGVAAELHDAPAGVDGRVAVHVLRPAACERDARGMVAVPAWAPCWTATGAASGSAWSRRRG